MVDQLESLTETYNAISALFPDNAPHKNPVTGVSLLDDVRDMMEDAVVYGREARDWRYECERQRQQLDNAALQMHQLQANNEQLLKALAEPLATAAPPKYILVPLHCIFCSFQGTLAELKQHSAVCQEHPAVKAMAEQGKI